MVTPVSETSGIYVVDVPMFGKTKVNSPYIVTGPEPAILDTGPADGADHILDGLRELEISTEAVSYIVPTHAHLDHAGGAGYLAEACPNATIVCHENAVEYLTDEEMLTHLAKSVERAIGMDSPYGDPITFDRERTRTCTGGETIDLGDRTLDVINAPGHAPHQLCFYDRKDEVMVAADANGMRFDGYHRPTTPPPNFDLADALATLDRLETFEPKTVLYAHYGPGAIRSGTEELQAYAEMLPAYVEEIDAARAEHGDDIGQIMLEMDDHWNHWSLSTDIAGILRYLQQAEA